MYIVSLRRIVHLIVNFTFVYLLIFMKHIYIKYIGDNRLNRLHKINRSLLVIYF